MINPRNWAARCTLYECDNKYIQVSKGSGFESPTGGSLSETHVHALRVFVRDSSACSSNLGIRTSRFILLSVSLTKIQACKQQLVPDWFSAVAN